MNGIVLFLQGTIGTIDWGAIIDKAPEIAVVIIFIWYSLERDKREAAALAAREQIRIAEVSKRDKEWREFLREERQWRAASLEGVVNELAELKIGHQTHDEWARGVVEEIKQLILQRP